MPRRELSLGRVLLIYLLGFAGGLQSALYLYDTFDDGISEPLSGAIALVFVGAGLGVIAWFYAATGPDDCRAGDFDIPAQFDD